MLLFSRYPYLVLQLLLLVVVVYQTMTVASAFIITARSNHQKIRQNDSPLVMFVQSSPIPSNQETTILPQPFSKLHLIEGIEFREIPMDLPLVGTVTILEATSESQEELVDMALLEENDDGVEESLITAGDPYGAVLWPAAWAVANYLIKSQSTTTTTTTTTTQKPLEGVSILEVGAGTGLVSIATALAGANVLATDYEPLALTLTKYAAKEFHDLTIETQIFDLCDTNTPLPYTDIVVAADIMYEPKTGRAMAHRVVEALRQNSRVIVGDSPGRAGRPAFLQTLKELGLGSAKFEDAIGRTCTGPRHDLICGKGSMSVSETPKELSVAIMDLYPSALNTSVEESS